MRSSARDNAAVATFFRTLKSEMIWRTVVHARAEAKDAIARDIDGFYNPCRRQSTLDLISPAQFERQAA
jgi:putative transposase